MTTKYSLLSDRRNAERKHVNVPVSVLSARPEAGFQSEKTETIDVSQTGVRLELSFPVHVGDRFSISSTAVSLQARMAIFEVKWRHRSAGRYMVGAEHINGEGRWRVLVA